MFLRQRFFRSVSSTLDVLREILESRVEMLTRHLARWAKGTALRFAWGAALALLAVFALGSGLAQALVALGLPPYAGHLVIAATAGLGAYGLFKAGAKRHVMTRPVTVWIEHRRRAQRRVVRVRVASPRRTRSDRLPARFRTVRSRARSP